MFNLGNADYILFAFNCYLAIWYAMGFNIVWLWCLFFMLDKDNSKFLLFVYQAVVVQN